MYIVSVVVVDVLFPEPPALQGQVNWPLPPPELVVVVFFWQVALLGNHPHFADPPPTPIPLVALASYGLNNATEVVIATANAVTFPAIFRILFITIVLNLVIKSTITHFALKAKIEFHKDIS